MLKLWKLLMRIDQLVTWQLRYLEKVIVHHFEENEELGYLDTLTLGYLATYYLHMGCYMSLEEVASNSKERLCYKLREV